MPADISTGCTLVTGATGFVGSALCDLLPASQVRRALRQSAEQAGPQDVIVGNIGPDTAWGAALRGVDRIVHLAARTHVLTDDPVSSLPAYRHINVAGSLNLARQAAAAGVRRFVFLSSIKVNGEGTTDRPYTERDAPHPEDAYGISKLEAEQALAQLCGEAGMELCVIRPPLVYGPRVKGNFLKLLNGIARGAPWPLASIRNLRSLVYVGNLASAIQAGLSSSAAAGQTFLVSDGKDLSTPDLIRGLAAAMQRNARVYPCPVRALELAGMLTGRSNAIRRLTGSLRIDSSKIRTVLGWTPPYTVEQGFAATARWYDQSRPVHPPD